MKRSGPTHATANLMMAPQDSLEEPGQGGRYVRSASGFRNRISRYDPVFKPEYGRYHLYISYACPWAHRTVAVVFLKGLLGCITVSSVHPTWQRTRPDSPTDRHCGWKFGAGAHPNVIGRGMFKGQGTNDAINGVDYLRDIYEMAQADDDGVYSTPVLWDKYTNTIVNNESSEIMRMLSSEFNEWSTGPMALVNLYPLSFRAEIDDANDWIYRGINDCVYKCGFARTQQAYDEAIVLLETSLERLESILSKNRFVVGPVFTETDIRLFVSLVRYDEVYVVYFKCNTKSVREYHNIRNYCREIYQTHGIADSVKMDDIKEHYFSYVVPYMARFVVAYLYVFGCAGHIPL
jgi:putative glutathione S-transferase